ALSARFRPKPGPYDLRLPDRLHAFMLFPSNPAQEVRGLVHADPGDLAAADLGQGLRDEDSEQGLCVVLSCSLVLGESAMEAQSSENVILEGVELGEDEGGVDSRRLGLDPRILEPVILLPLVR